MPSKHLIATIQSSRWIAWLSAMVVAFLLAPEFCSAQPTDAYYAEIWTGQGEPIRDGVMVVADGKISAVGERNEVQVPASARRHDFGHQVIIPGLVVAHSGLTTGSTTEYTMSPEVNALDGFDFFADRSKLLEGGVTTVQISPGDNRLISGVDAVVKLTGDAEGERTAEELVESGQLQVILDSRSRNPPTIYEPPVGPVSVERPLTVAQPQISQTLASSLAGLRLVLNAATADEQYVSSGFDTVSGVVNGQLRKSSTVRVAAKTAAEIRGALGLARDYDLQLVLLDSHDLAAFENSLADWNETVAGVVLAGLKPGAITNSPATSLEEEVMPWKYARELIDAGVPVAIRPNSDSDLSSLLFAAGQFMQDGLNPREALAMVTSAPAQMLGVENRVGQLAKGRDADFVVLNGPPFELRSKVLATYVNGKKAFDRQKDRATLVVRASEVWTGEGEVLSESSVVVADGQVRNIGDHVSAPLDAQERDFGDAVIVPGFVDLGTGLGIGGSLSGNVSLDTRLGDQLYPDDPAIQVARENGVTTVLLGSLNTSQPTPLVAYKLGDDVRVIADPVAIRFQFGDDPAASLKAIGAQLKRGKAYVDSWAKYEKDLVEYEKKKAEAEKAKAEAGDSANGDDEGDEKQGQGDKADEKETKNGDEEAESDDGGQRRRGRRGRGPEKNGDREEPSEDEDGDEEDQKGDKDEKGDQDEDKDKEESGQDGEDEEKENEDKEEELKPPKKPRVQEKLEPYRALFAKEIPAIVEARKANAIEAALKLFREDYDVRTILSGADDITRFPDLLDDRDVSVCAGPNLVLTIRNPNQPEKQVNVAQVLANEGIHFGVHSKATTGVRQLPLVVQYAVSRGLGTHDALAALTSAPAKMLSEKYSFGRLKQGSDADLVVLSGPPFELSTRVLAVMIDGEWVYERDKNEP